jgi:death-on-curing protein
MPDDTHDELSDLLERIEYHTAASLDLTVGSPELVQFLAAVATYLNTLAVTDFGGRLGRVRQEGLVEQVIGAAFQTFGGREAHPDPFEKAAMLLRGITAGHPFQDGNKRTGFLLAVFYLEQVGFPLPEHLDVSDAESLALRVSAGTLRDIDVIAAQLHQLWQQ